MIKGSMRLENVNIPTHGIVPLISPAKLKKEMPLTPKASQTVTAGRQGIINILISGGQRLIAIVGPCSIHDPVAAIDYARRLSNLSKKLADKLLLVMRVYFEKPRTTVGWRGLITEPQPGNGFEVEKGLRIARRLLLQINKLGLPTATEFLDPIVPQFIADLISWGAVGARTTESQIHREMASGLSMPVGFKNGTDGNMQIAADAIVAARSTHAFLGVNSAGQISVVHTTGNPWGHLILRGGANSPNFSASNVAQAIRMLDETDTRNHSQSQDTKILIDCSHGNSAKDYTKQVAICRAVVDQIREGNGRIVGFMLESNINSGRQELSGQLAYGVSVTDACLGWEETEQLLLDVYHIIG